jgi:SpoIIAA-like
MSSSAGPIIAVHDVGPHRVTIELPDIMHVRYDGDVSIDEFKVMDAFVANFPGNGAVYVLRDARRGGQTSLETRAYMARAARVTRLRAVVSYGSSFRSRTLVDMTQKAIKALRQEGPEVAFFETEEEARLWILQRRDQCCENLIQP